MLPEFHWSATSIFSCGVLINRAATLNSEGELLESRNTERSPASVIRSVRKRGQIFNVEQFNVGKSDSPNPTLNSGLTVTSRGGRESIAHRMKVVNQQSFQY